MSRACVTYEIDAKGDFVPVAVLLATPRRLQAKTLPGDPVRQDWLDRLCRAAKGPQLADGTMGTCEDLIGYFVGDPAQEWPGALANGHTTWAAEVKPEVSVDALYRREVLRTDARPLTRPDLRPTTEEPTGLGGWRAK